ncbi:MAG: ArsA family ATPase, partial [Longimicrobiales bacterium]
MPTELARRWIFVVGKGGVGKTTTAGAIGLALADTGERTHLISTDPAHSLADLFEAAPAPSPTASPCTDALILEELDAASYAERWRAELAGPLSEVIERGTYLDAEDAARFLGLSIPGIDELMAALRLAELDESGPARIVVDTAPTGHTLRLLDSGRSLGGWITAFEAMEEKAEAVASAFAGRTVRLAAADALAKLESAVSIFEERVLPEADVVLVGRAEPTVVAETERLEAALRRRGMRIALRVAVGPGWAPGGEWVGARLPDSGAPCEALRGWRLGPVDESRSHRVGAGRPRETSGAGPAARTTTAAGKTTAAGTTPGPGTTPLDLLADRRLL